MMDPRPVSTELYDASVPVFVRYLKLLSGLVETAESHAAHAAQQPADILGARLAADMLPFEMQVTIAANFSLRACYPLAGRDIPSYGEFPNTFEGLQRRLTHVLSLLNELDPNQFRQAASRHIESQAGKALVGLAAPDFLRHYALPNFFFHLTTAYAILRSRGVGVGKAQFDGFHEY